MSAAFGTAIAGESSTVSAPALRVSFSWTIAGNLIYALCQFGMLSTLAKLGNPSVVGQYALALAVASPLFMFTNLQLRGVQSTDARNEYEFADYFTLRCLSTLLAVVVIAAIVLLGRYDRTTKFVILLVAAAKAIETFSDVIAGHLQKIERLDQVARALTLRGLVSVTTFTFVFWITRNLVIATATLAITWMVVIALYDFRVVSRVLHNQVFFRYSSSVLRRLVWLSIPLGLVMALISLNTNIPRYLLERKLGTAELGIFASMAYLITSMNLIVGALGQSVCTRMSRLLANGDVHRFRVLIGKLIGISILLGIVGVAGAAIFGKLVLTMVYRPEYANHVNLLIVLVIDAAVGAAASFLGFGMTAARCFRSQVPIMVATVLTAAVLTLALLPYCGLMGAGFALLASSMVQGAISYLVLNSAIKMQALA
ncbi:MAG: oligosaccharide flippase family protein [Candidatus Sulfotelmatobacter sp.]|jgi:O-antigen/teichoic acid export membrane protein